MSFSFFLLLFLLLFLLPFLFFFYTLLVGTFGGKRRGGVCCFCCGDWDRAGLFGRSQRAWVQEAVETRSVRRAQGLLMGGILMSTDLPHPTRSTRRDHVDSQESAVRCLYHSFSSHCLYCRGCRSPTGLAIIISLTVPVQRDLRPRPPSRPFLLSLESLRVQIYMYPSRARRSGPRRRSESDFERRPVL